ncbi:sensor domain-containing diguanylate cyclase [Parashewanella hymeniacidonis]|uniref:GGDEF domain-containing protein n=1 Tax=Parashewanella hymeniacidonis TaxID=2807618 RepID=UPI001EF61435|nr:GGDEF domain-containing protein [Parashewanella hymeniacidonis]
MPKYLQNLRIVAIPFLATFVCLFAIYFQQEHWQSWRPILRELPLWLLPISAVIAIQFNRSRLSYLALIFTFYFAVERSLLFDSQTLQQNALVIFSTMSAVMAFLALSKDRGLASIFTLLNIMIISVLCVMGYFWHHYQASTLALFENNASFLASKGLIEMLPWGISAILITVATIRNGTLTSTAIALSFSFWSMIFFSPELFPTAILLTVLAALYFISILFDSYTLAYRDELTTLPSRRALYNLVLSLGPKYSVAMMDIDHFKKFNDTYGHDVGDQVLKLVASKLSKVSGGGKVFRYGGEEFTVIFSRKNAADTIEHLEAVRQSIEDYKIVIRNDDRKNDSKKSRSKMKQANKTVSVTISIGVAEHGKGETFDQTLKQADLALYDAKKKGRNQVCLK